MAKSSAITVQEYLDTLPPDRREAISRVREAILKNLPKGYVELMNWGMINYVIPLERYPNTYNKQPLSMAALASQKNHMTVYLMTVYGDKETEKWFRESYKASGKKLDMGKSCVHFKKLDDLPLDLIGEAIRRCSVEKYIQRYEQARRHK
jgi:hypothetical protein